MSFPRLNKSFSRLTKSFHQDIMSFPRLNKSFPQDIMSLSRSLEIIMSREQDIKLRERPKNKMCMSLPGFRIFTYEIETNKSINPVRHTFFKTTRSVNLIFCHKANIFCVLQNLLQG